MVRVFAYISKYPLETEDIKRPSLESRCSKQQQAIRRQQLESLSPSH